MLDLSRRPIQSTAPSQIRFVLPRLLELPSLTIGIDVDATLMLQRMITISLEMIVIPLSDIGILSHGIQIEFPAAFFANLLGRNSRVMGHPRWMLARNQ